MLYLLKSRKLSVAVHHTRAVRVTLYGCLPIEQTPYPPMSMFALEANSLMSPKWWRAKRAALRILYIVPPSSLALHLSFFFSSALFAYWLRSSVVSVLFSLISEIRRQSEL